MPQWYETVSTTLLLFSKNLFLLNVTLLSGAKYWACPGWVCGRCSSPRRTAPAWPSAPSSRPGGTATPTQRQRPSSGSSRNCQEDLIRNCGRFRFKSGLIKKSFYFLTICPFNFWVNNFRRHQDYDVFIHFLQNQGIQTTKVGIYGCLYIRSSIDAYEPYMQKGLSSLIFNKNCLNVND